MDRGQEIANLFEVALQNIYVANKTYWNMLIMLTAAAIKSSKTFQLVQIEYKK